MPELRRKRRSFLQWVDQGEKQVAILLTVITAVVIGAALVQLTVKVTLALITTDQDAYWLGDGLIRILGDLLTVLIALEVLQNITSYLRRHVVQIELVLVTALTAVARKVIVLPAGSENKPQIHNPALRSFGSSSSVQRLFICVPAALVKTPAKRLSSSSTISTMP